MRPYLVIYPGGGQVVADFAFQHKDGGFCFVSIGWDETTRNPFHIIEGDLKWIDDHWECGGVVVKQLTESDRQWDNWQAWVDYKSSPDWYLSRDPDTIAIEACQRDGAIGEPLKRLA